MALAEWFTKHYNSDITGVGKTPLRTRVSKYRHARAMRKQSFLGAKVIQTKELRSSTEKEKAARPVRIMGVPKPGE